MLETAKIEEIFWHATGLTDANERLAYLKAACEGNSELLKRVSALLLAGKESGGFLETPACSRIPPSDYGSFPDHRINECAEFPFLAAPARTGDLGTLGPYHIEKCVGRGGMGIVFQAFDPKLQRVVAIKVLAPGIAIDPNARNRFEREARSAAAVTHPNIVVIHAVDEQHVPPYLVMEFVEGKTLADKLAMQGALSVKEILRIGVQVAEGLAAAHKQGLIHRDIKPSNILLENGIERAKVSDFGLAKTMNDVALTREGELSGTPNFMSPEQASGGVVDHRTDLFSLGAVLYAMCTGHPPFEASSLVATLNRILNESPPPLQRFNADAPIWLSSIVDRLLAKSPSDRFPSATEVARLLRKHLARLQAGTMIPRWEANDGSSAVATTLKRLLSNKFASGLLLIIGLLFLLVFSILCWSLLPDSPSYLIGPRRDINPTKTVGEIVPRSSDETTLKSRTQTKFDEPRVGIDLIVKKYSEDCDKARQQLLDSMDRQIVEIKQSLATNPDAKASRTELLDAEKAICLKTKTIPFSPMMRADAMTYLRQMKDAQTKALDSLKKLSYEDFMNGKKLLAPVKVGRWRFSDPKNSKFKFIRTLNSDGTIREVRSGTWTLSKTSMVLRSPDLKAPGGAWIDICVVAESGLTLSMQNQQKHRYTAHRVE